MKILMVSMRSIHFKRWCEQLEHTNHELHWFDVTDGSAFKELHWLKHHQNWRYKGKNTRGRTFLKKYFPKLHRMLEQDLAEAFEKVLQEVRPDAVQSFVMYKSAVPIFEVMQRNPHIKWIYSSWGSDLYYFKNLPDHRADLERVLPHIDYLFTDNFRDKAIAEDLGFRGKFLGAFPGGGGFHSKLLASFVLPLEQRDVILVKGYQGRSGRAIPVLNALLKIREKLASFKIMVFGADAEVVQYIHHTDFLKQNIAVISSKKQMMAHTALLKQMGAALIYIGNSNSDGMPNTLLEAMIMGAFPIQSNPGGVTEEVLEHQKNGLLISNEENIDEIAALIERAIDDQDLREQAFKINQQLKEEFGFEAIKEKVIECYASIERDLKS